MKKNLLILFSLLIVVTAKGQWNYKASNAQNITGAYTDLGTAGSPITTNFSGGVMTFDDDNSSVQNIGFTFNFDGAAYTQFVLNTNGFIKLGSGAVSAANIYYSVAQGSGSNTGGCVLASDADLIYALNHDLGPATSGGLPEYRVSTSGTAGSRICTIQFKNLADKIGGTLVQFANINFQIQLYEGTGKIDFVYGPWTNSANPTNFITNAVGIKGLATANSVNVVKGSAGVWSTSSFINGNYAAAANTHNIRNSIMTGEPGRTYRFYPTYPNDAAVSVVYTLGKLPIPYVVPHTISTRIINAGTNTLTNLPVSLSITGANTFAPPAQIIFTLAPGDSTTVIFPAFSPSNIGTNTVSVSVPTDDNNINNLFSLSQEITNNSYTYAYGAIPTSGVGFNGATGDFAALFTTNTPTSVNQVSVNFFNGGQPFQIGIWDKGAGGKPGANIFTSASQISTTGVFTLPVNPPINITDTFFVGVMQSGTTNLQFAYQKESPIRPGVFFFTQPHLGTTWTDFAPNNAFRFMIEPRLTIANDVGVSSINNPVGASSIDNCGIVPQADVTNFGSSNQTTPFNVTFSIKQSGSTVYSDTKQVSLNSGQTKAVYFTPFTGSLSGSDSSFAVTSLATDGATNNDTVVNKFTTSVYSYSDSTLTSDGYSYANSTICANPAPLKPVYNWVTENSNEINWL